MKRIITTSIKGFNVEKDIDYIHIECEQSSIVLSSAILNGGLTKAEHIVNVKVPRRGIFCELPEKSLERYCANAGWNGICVGMMTAASMNSLQIQEDSLENIDIAVLVTLGLSNPRCVGDKAEIRQMIAKEHKTGTINIIALTNGKLAPAAMAEAIMIITEAKTEVLRNTAVKSPVSNKTATGTGTDSVAIVSAGNSNEIRYCGKHVRFGEILGNLTVNAITNSISWYFK